eukprot:gene16750-19916_t
MDTQSAIKPQLGKTSYSKKRRSIVGDIHLPFDKEREGEALEEAIRKQVEYYLSRDNLANDAYLGRQMNSEMFVAISTIAGFKALKNLTTDVELIVKSISKSTSVVLDDAKQMIRPAFKLQRNIVILRDIPSDTAHEEIRKIFTTAEAAITNIRSDIGNTWFITFDTEENALSAHDAIQNAVFNEKPIKARIKSETLLRNNYVAPPVVAPIVAPHLNGVAPSNITNNNTSNNNRTPYYTMPAKTWSRPVGGYPYGGWDQGTQANGEIRQYDPSKGSGEHRKPYRSKDGSTPSTNTTSNSSSTSEPSTQSQPQATLNNATTATTTPSTTTANVPQQLTNNFSTDRPRKPHTSSNKPASLALNGRAPYTPAANSTGAAPTSPTGADARSKPATLPGAVGANKPRTTKPAKKQSSSDEKEPRESAKEAKIKANQTPPGPQHFPPLVKGEDGEKKKESTWGPASTSSPVVAAAATPVPAPVAQPTATTAAPSTVTGASTSSPASTSPTTKPANSKKSGANSPATAGTPASSKKSPKVEGAKADKKRTTDDAAKKPASSSVESSPVTTPTLNGISAPATTTPTEKKQPTYADIIQGAKPIVTATPAAVTPVTPTPSTETVTATTSTPVTSSQ